MKATKGRRNRNVTIEAPVLPLLDAIKAELGDTGPLMPAMPSERDMARGLRRWLLQAGVDRHELHHRTPTTRPIRFHDLRATGITWMAVRDDDPLEIQHRAGRTEFETTQRYIRMTEALGEGFGEPFPALLTGLVSHAAIARGSANQRNYGWNLRGGRDSNAAREGRSVAKPAGSAIVTDRPNESDPDRKCSNWRRSGRWRDDSAGADERPQGSGHELPAEMLVGVVETALAGALEAAARAGR